MPPDWFATHWPALAGIAALAVAWGETRQKVAELRDWRKGEEKRRTAEEERRRDEAESLEAIRLDIREIKTVLKIRSADVG